VVLSEDSTEGKPEPTGEEDMGEDRQKENEGTRATKHDILSFVRGAQGIPSERKGFVDGEWWSDESEFKSIYVEEGWTDEDGFVTEKGAALINHADRIYNKEDGFDIVLAVLNDEGAERFVKEAVEEYDEEDVQEQNESRFTGTGSFTDTDGGFF
jgi:hypothetical protein